MRSQLDRVRGLVHRCSTLALATADPHRISHSTPLFYVADEALHLYWFSSRRSLHSRHLAENPPASVAVFPQTDQWKQICGVQMRGLVSIVEDRERRREIAGIYCERFALGELFSAVMRRSALYCFTPSWLRYIDNGVRFGYKFEMKFPAAERAG